MADTDAPDFLGSGWAFPLRVNARGGIATSRGEDDVAESIRVILSTPRGERRMRTDFGCAVHDLAFATNDPTTHGMIGRYTEEALALWEPRIQVADVRVNVDPDDPSRVYVDISYDIRATNERRNLVYPFYLIPGEE